jgi:hypothetical protein
MRQPELASILGTKQVHVINRPTGRGLANKPLKGRPHLVVTCDVLPRARRSLTALGFQMRSLLNGGTLGGRRHGNRSAVETGVG